MQQSLVAEEAGVMPGIEPSLTVIVRQLDERIDQRGAGSRLVPRQFREIPGV